MYQLHKEFSEDLQEGKTLIVMPLTRLLFYEPFSIGNYRFYPAGSVDIKCLRPVPNQTLANQPNYDGVIKLEGQALREVSTSLTGFSINVLETNPLVSFTTELNWDEFLGADHEYDIDLLKILSLTAERALDLIRFDYCRFDLPDTLPGVVGSWDNSGQFLGALLYTKLDHESYLIAGAAISVAVVVKGLGLEIDHSPKASLFDSSDGEVAGIALHGLSLFSDVMTASNETTKFARIMTLLEFLASPDEYKKWQDLKGEIICHSAKDKTDYHRLTERFRELTSIKDIDGKQKGYRTLIVHYGKFIEEIIPSSSERNKLFRELQFYCMDVLDSMFKNHTMSWQEFSEHRGILKKKLGVK